MRTNRIEQLSRVCAGTRPVHGHFLIQTLPRIILRRQRFDRARSQGFHPRMLMAAPFMMVPSANPPPSRNPPESG